MIPSILLALTVIIAMIDVLVGIHRGFGFGIVRLLIWIAGTVVCVLLARPVTVWLLLKIAKVSDMDAFSSEVFGGFLGNGKEAIGTHMTGTTVSFLVPIVFVALFIISKLVTWIIYLIVKKLIKKAAKRAEAHNAAFDAVKAIEHMEIADADSMGASPIPQPSFNDDKPDDFGTFGIFPKEEVNQEGEYGTDPEEGNSEAGASDVPTEEAADENYIYGALTADDGKNIITAEPVGIAEADEAGEEADLTEESSPAETIEYEDGFEAIAASAEDGFESLARSTKKEKADKPKKVKVKKRKETKPRDLKKKRSLSLWIIRKSLASSIAGGILGLFISLLACAIIMMPVTEIFKMISQKEDAEAVVDLVFTLSSMDTEGFIDKAFEKGNRPVPVVQKEIELTSDISIRSQDFVETFTDGDKTVVYSIYKYSGANAVASFIYDRLITVDVDSIKLGNKGFETYNFRDTVSCYLGLIPRVNSLISVINQGKGVSVELISTIKDCLDSIIIDRGKGELLTHNDKLVLVNNLIESLNKRLEMSPIMQQSETGIIQLELFTDYDEMRIGLENMFDLVKRLISAGMLE